MKHINEQTEIEICKAWLKDKPRAKSINRKLYAVDISQRLEKIVKLRIHQTSVIKAANELGIKHDGKNIALQRGIIESYKQMLNQRRREYREEELPYKYDMVPGLDNILNRAGIDRL